MNINGTGPASEWAEVDTFENDLDESAVPGEPSGLKCEFYFMDGKSVASCVL